jgi:hypothetical protein
MFVSVQWNKEKNMKCPECGEELEIPVVDIGVGNQQIGPAFCPECHWEEGGRGGIDFYDGVEEKEEKERMEDRGEMEHPPY